MKRILCFFLCIIIPGSLLVLQTSAANFQVTYYCEEIYAGGIMDLYAFTGTGGAEPFTYQWQAQGYGWIDLADNAVYEGTKTNHLQLHTGIGDYGDWDAIPFQCVVTDAQGTVRYTPSIYMKIYPTDKLIPNMRKWGFCLYEPTLTNVSNLHTSDYIGYTANTYAGNKVTVSVGSTPVESRAILQNSEVKLTREIHITENGHTTQAENQTTYVPYTVGSNAVTIDIKLRLSIGGHDLGDYETKTIKLNVNKPTVVSTATAKYDCSLLRYTYNESQKLVSIPKGATVEILSKDGGYYQVFYNNMVGYVGTSLLNVQDSGYDPVIKDVNVVIPAPVAGKKPAFTCSVLTKGSQLYQTDPITWTDKETNRALTATDTFQEGHSYSLSIWLAAKDGYKFQVGNDGKPKLTGTINGNLPPFIYKAYEQDPEKVIELIYSFNNVQSAPPEQSHTCTPVLVPRVDPSCTETGFEAYYRCACGMHYADSQGQTEVNTSMWGTIPATGHTPSGWRTTQIVHYKECTTCGEFLEEQDHSGGTATCTKQAKCAVCGEAYGKLEDHLWSPTWLHREKAGHAWICAHCKIHSPVQAHAPGAAATEKSPQVCTDCGYIITPARQHTHNLTKVPKVPATCTQAGNAEYYTCSGCADRFTDAAGKNKITDQASIVINPLGHVVSDDWKYDAKFHWRICSVCAVVLDETKMLHEEDAGKCATCGYQTSTGNNPQENETTPTVPAGPGVETTPPTTEATAPTTSSSGKDPTTESTKAPSVGKDPDTQDPPSEEGMRISWEMAVMIGLVCFGISVILTAVILKRKKK